jgi:DNA-binding response OmpR family regulator
VVWVCISSLRKKLITIEAEVEIKARRNIGYFLEGK